MRQVHLLFVTLGLLFINCGADKTAKEESTPLSDIKRSKIGYNVDADPAKDLQEAVSRARLSGKKILLEVGGEWCKWCHILENFLHENKDIDYAWHQAFEIVRINYSEENKNEEFLEAYPKVNGYPHFFVLDASGKLLHSQNTADLESEKSYDTEKFHAFINKWSK